MVPHNFVRAQIPRVEKTSKTGHDVGMSTPSQTIPQLLAATVEAVADRQALATIADEKLSWRTWAEVNAEVNQLAQAMLSVGILNGDRVVQVAANCYEWIITDLAIHRIGAVHVPLHTSLSAAQVADHVGDCGAKLVFLSAEAFRNVANELEPTLKIVYYGKPILAEANDGNASTVGLHEFLENATEGLTPTPPQASDLATLLYTSGTTGTPRGVMLSHENIVSNTIATDKAIHASAEDLRLCFLPFSHIYARTCDLYGWLHIGSQLVVAESKDTILRDCKIAKPTVINGVPYFYQKIAHFEDLREQLGGRINCCFCGGAGVAPEVEKIFASQKLPLLPGYGLTESSPVISVSNSENYRHGTVGRPLTNVEVHIDDSGEILARGPSIMLGYWQNEEATQEAIVDGWLQTGDLGEFDEAGNLRIVGRKKEIIVLMTGKNVSPTRVEQTLAGSSLIDNSCVIGDGRKCLGALIVPNKDSIVEEITQRQIKVDSPRQAVNHPHIQELFRLELDRILADASHEEQVGPFLLLDREFTLDKGEMTPKLSLRRKVIETNFASEINAMYDR